MVGVGRAEAAFGFALLVVVEDPLDVEDCELPPGLVCERDAVALRRIGHCEADRERPRQAARQVHALDDSLVVLPAHEPRQRRERPNGEHVEVGEPRAT